MGALPGIKEFNCSSTLSFILGNTVLGRPWWQLKHPEEVYAAADMTPPWQGSNLMRHYMLNREINSQSRPLLWICCQKQLSTAQRTQGCSNFKRLCLVGKLADCMLPSCVSQSTSSPCTRITSLPFILLALCDVHVWLRFYVGAAPLAKYSHNANKQIQWEEILLTVNPASWAGSAETWPS